MEGEVFFSPNALDLFPPDWGHDLAPLVLGPGGYTLRVTGEVFAGSTVTVVSSFTILAPTATPTNTPCVDGRTSYQYDANGNLIREENCLQATLFEYDFENRLSRITYPDGRIETYLYDFSGHLVRKTVDSITTTSIYGRGVAPYSEKVEGSGTFTNFLLVNGKTYAKRNNGTLKFFHHDALGSVSAISDTSGTLTDTYEYDPFGRLLAHNGTEVNDRLFVGGFGVRDIGAGRSIMGVRLYDAELGRFLQEDPISFLGGDINLHRYVSNNSLRAIDPSGLTTKIYFFPATSFGVDHGHVGIGIDDEMPRGYYPTGSPLGSTGALEIEKGEPFFVLEIDTTKEQEQKIRESLDPLESNPGDFNLLTNNCADVASQALRNSGIPFGSVGLVVTPKTLQAVLTQANQPRDESKPTPVGSNTLLP